MFLLFFLVLAAILAFDFSCEIGAPHKHKEIHNVRSSSFCRHVGRVYTRGETCIQTSCCGYVDVGNYVCSLLCMQRW